ncbi:hypothetical protein AGMMS50249_3670 [candidate division SR1 bacterium]|nr:hypothetical protein AGMMS50249_3670 [candidate division SR1 bacterium]
MRIYKPFLGLMSLVAFYSVSSAAILIFNVGADIPEETLSPVSFMVGGNHFPGALFLSTPESVSETITNAGESVDCEGQINGLYYNQGRGEVIWPLENISSTTLTTDGGLYTECTGWTNPNPDGETAILGYIEHEYTSGTTVTHNMIAGLQYTGTHIVGGVNNPIPASPFANTFVMIEDFDNIQYFAGMIYDVIAGGIGFVGCRPIDTGDIETVISAFNDGVNKVITGNNNSLTRTAEPVIGTGILTDKVQCDVGMLQRESRWIKILGIIGNIYGSDPSKDARSQLFATVKVNQSSLTNAAKRASETLCRGDQRNKTSRTDKVTCINESRANGEIYLSEYEGQTLIVKDHDVIVPYSYLQKADQQPVDLFIDGGKLILKQERSTGSLKSFDALGLYSPTAGVSSGEILKGNFIINGVIIGSGFDGYTIPHKLFIHGKFTSLNTIEADTSVITARESQLSKLGLNGITTSQIELKEIFTRTCTNRNKSTDGTNCNAAQDRSFFAAPLIIINQNYPSKLI